MQIRTESLKTSVVLVLNSRTGSRLRLMIIAGTDEVRYSGPDMKLQGERNPKAIPPTIYYLIRRSNLRIAGLLGGGLGSPPTLMPPFDTAKLAQVSTVQSHAKEVLNQAFAFTPGAPSNCHNRK